MEKSKNLIRSSRCVILSQVGVLPASDANSLFPRMLISTGIRALECVIRTTEIAGLNGFIANAR